MAEEEENPYPVAPGASYIESKFPPWNVGRVVDELGYVLQELKRAVPRQCRNTTFAPTREYSSSGSAPA